MPINYLQLQPQIQQFGLDARHSHDQIESKLQVALELLRLSVQGHPENQKDIIHTLEKKPGTDRCALPAGEQMDVAVDLPPGENPYCVLAADGSQITPDAHEALSVALVNISLIHFQPGSGQAPSVTVNSRFLHNAGGQIVMEQISEEQVNLERDVGELRMLAKGLPENSHPVVALRDGALELFHQPRQGRYFDEGFKQYLEGMRALSQKNIILAGYIDKPRADLVVSMLPFSVSSRQDADLSGLSDVRLFQELLQPGQRSAIYKLLSSSGTHYQDDLGLHFFYLNTGSKNKAWIARVEIPAWVAGDRQRVDLLHQALLDQCHLMGQRPYPYLLHRAHEEAVVHQDEKDQLLERLAFELQCQGLGISHRSHKLSAKELPARTRKKR